MDTGGQLALLSGESHFGTCFCGIDIQTQFSVLTASSGSSLWERRAVRMRKEIISVPLPLHLQSRVEETVRG